MVSDFQGSPRLLVRTDTGGVSQEIRYDEFGSVTLDTDPGGQPFGFAGSLKDPLTGFGRLGRRDYDSKPGRWTVRDPHTFYSRDANHFIYAGAGPVNNIDPAGTTWCDIKTALDVARDLFPPGLYEYMKIPATVKVDDLDPYVGMTGPLREITLDDGYLKDLSDPVARDLMDTVLHESMHAAEPLSKFLLPRNSKKYEKWHKEIERRAKELTGHAIDEFHRRRSLCPCED